ncbi:MAG: acetyl-CoA carboxylase biotin carboxyl carrier protein subunit [Thermogladius sp.]|jgi:biotin carboxyl carrier protein|nr:acetyl-CoA carboxylase biotin carboxyl carrier protein subunit [Thermogladius sp.]
MPRKIRVKTVYGQTYELVIDKLDKDKFKLKLPDGREVEMRIIKLGSDRVLIDYDGVSYSIFFSGDQAFINTQPLLVSNIAEIYETRIERREEEKKTEVAGGKVVKAPIAGRVVDVKVKPGDRVKQGDVVVVMESMKMIIEVKSHLEGEVAEVHVKKGQSVGKDSPLISLK